ncbi:hypothetical protein Nepgr_032328 [Nepenthes gracilis]|uniref:DUF641 domain-containing protein n=1 Tax=Nepenthes gracilis TaxID=150966 RepID=A0AAD3TID6_NEPGR|nr:hypothetical protein Nepgr_032328 [Nepenthes gracilis]
MECMKPPSDSNKTRLSRTFSKCIHPQTPTRFVPNQNDGGVGSGKANTKSQEFTLKEALLLTRQKSQPWRWNFHADDQEEQVVVKRGRAAKAALLAQLFASISSIKAAYAELQKAQFPYDSDAIHCADQAVVNQLMELSELKHKYWSSSSKALLDLPPPHITQLLAEIQEQQSNIKTYEITIKQMESRIQQCDSEIASLREKLEESIRANKCLEKKLDCNPIRQLGNIAVSDLNQCYFIQLLNLSMRSVRAFVRQLAREMEAKNWDTDLAAAKAIEFNDGMFPFPKARHKAFAFESFVCRVMFDGFNHQNFTLTNSDEDVNGNEQQQQQRQRQLKFFDEFQKLKSDSTYPFQFPSENPECKFVEFCRTKYLKLVHPKMECSFFGSLDSRKLIINSGAFPFSANDFHTVFVEMAKRIWVLHCVAFSSDHPALAFRVKKGCRFSEVYMESVADGGDLWVAFTVVPGFKLGKTVIQSQVYLHPAVGRV